MIVLFLYLSCFPKTDRTSRQVLQNEPIPSSKSLDKTGAETPRAPAEAPAEYQTLQTIIPGSSNSLSGTDLTLKERLNRIEKQKEPGGPRFESYFPNLHDSLASLEFDLFNPEDGSIVTDLIPTDIDSIYMFEGNKSCRVPEFKLIPQKKEMRRPLDLGIILDHSGSMGEERAHMLQDAVAQSLKLKKRSDQISLYKFDKRTQKLIVSKDYPTLYNMLVPTDGLMGFGWATAIEDSILGGIEDLSSSAYENKALVLFTDGRENASKRGYHILDILNYARNYYVHIITVGFGDDIDEPYLKKISAETGAFYYRIYRKEEFYSLFSNIFLRINHAYRIDFAPCLFGERVRVRTKINLDGLPYESEVLFRIPPKKGKGIEMNVLFEHDKATIQEGYHKDIKNLVSLMKDNPSMRVELTGHTDDTGEESYNQKLSKRRAESIKNYMMQNGIESERIETIGMGEKEPLFSNDTEENKRRNRRTEVRVLSP
ncbi:MAG: OmpA family protein [Myxococcota bacterium]|nr:OmpA family protein [Myxococcota bacterium]